MRAVPPAALADYAAILEVPGLPTENRAWTLNNRQSLHQEQGDTQAAIEDLTQIIELADVPSEATAVSHLNRGILYLRDGLARKALLDFSAAIALPDASVQTKGEALLLRAEAYAQLDEPQKANADKALVFGFSRTWRNLKIAALVFLCILGVAAYFYFAQAQ